LPFLTANLKVFLSAQKKKEKFKNFFEELENQRIFIYKVFAILVFLLIKSEVKEIDAIIIDEEYPGKNSLIKNFLLQEIRKIKPDFDRGNIIFQKIGKKSRAHFLAYGIAVGKKKPILKLGREKF